MGIYIYPGNHIPNKIWDISLTPESSCSFFQRQLLSWFLTLHDACPFLNFIYMELYNLRSFCLASFIQHSVCESHHDASCIDRLLSLITKQYSFVQIYLQQLISSCWWNLNVLLAIMSVFALDGLVQVFMRPQVFISFQSLSRNGIGHRLGAC